MIAYLRRAASLRIPDAAILYLGPSRLDGSPIVVIATGIRSPSSNEKTGAMVQTWILRQDRAPHVAAMDGSDAAICGDCPHRFNPETRVRTCYVTTHQAPLSVWKAWQRGNYVAATSQQLAWIRAASSVRMGAYGDPAAVPLAVWHSCVDPMRKSHTGYTHQWRGMSAEDARAYQALVMASADGADDAVAARSRFWRTFRVAPKGEWGTAVRVERGPDNAVEITCPSDSKGSTCAACTLCRGSGTSADLHLPSIVIDAHGASASKVGRGLRVLQ